MTTWSSYHKRRRMWAVWLTGIVAVVMAFNMLFPPPVSQARHVSPVVNGAHGDMLSSFTVEDGTWRLPADLGRIDRRFTQRLIAIEDKRFYRHSGVDLPAIARALYSWKREGEAVSGASTLTMQLVRQLEPRPRNLRSKAIEMVRAVQFEMWMSKGDILQAYLSHVSYGGNIEGVEAAARLYLGKTPEYLTDSEIALLISLPQAPEARRPDRRPDAAIAARDTILEKLLKNGNMDALSVSEAKQAPIGSARSAMSDTAWITAHGLSGGAQGVVQSTLDTGLQLRLENFVKTQIDELPQAVNMAVVVVENKTLAVRAHIASADRTRPGGWIDMTNRPRSPGSTLKPFIYGLAMDEGLLTAGSAVFDAPTRFGSYRPENFNRRYHGNVRIHEALRHSLNVPAVAALDLIGGDHFEQSLSGAGAKMTRLGSKADKAGLALALGGVGLSVNDLAMLYAALANGGTARPLKWLAGDDREEVSFALLNLQSAADITRILAQAPTPDGRMPSWLREGGASIAYKTGTSYGYRDAWAAGYTDDFTVVVWVGRPDGAPRIGETGRLAAAPLLFDIFDRLPLRSVDSFYQKDDQAPAGLKALGKGADKAPHILFPPDGAEIFTDIIGETSRGFTISARVEGETYAAYINGALLKKIGRHYVWRPEASGFYTLSVIDSAGRQSQSNVRVLSTDSLAAQATGFHKNVNAPL